MSDFIEYPKALYSSAGKFATVGSKDAEDAQWAEWGESIPVDAVDLPNPLAVKVDQDPVANLAPEPTADPAPEPTPEPAPEPVATEASVEPAAEPQA
jgi:hypothetical protein